MKAYIKAIEYYLPEKVLSNEDINRDFPEWSIEKIAQKTGIKSRHISAIDEFASDMAVSAARKLFLVRNVDPESIDFVLLCTQSPDYLLPATACLVQHELGLSTRCGAVDINQGCSGYIYGLALSKGLIVSGVAKNVLLLTSETYTKFLQREDKSSRTIFGDGASATLISTQGFASIEDFDLGTDGSGAGNLILKERGSRHPELTYEYNNDDLGNIHSPSCIYMNGPEIFTFTSKTVPELIENTLKTNNINIAQIDLFIFHQANRYMLNHLRKKIGIPEDKFYYFIENSGNTVSSTIPIALCEARVEGVLKGNIVLAGFGVGYSWGGCILKIVDNE